MHLAKGEGLLPENFPELSNLSAGFLFKFVPRPLQVLPPEFVYIPIDTSRPRDDSKSLQTELTIAEWNAVWEAGHLRSEFVPQVMRRDFPKELKWLSEIKNANLYLVPDGRGRSKFDAFSPLYHLLPLDKLQRFGLPPLRRGLWPPWMHQHTLDRHIKSDFDERLARAFASHVWPLLNSGSRIYSFSKDDPIVLLAHNLNFWLPCVYKVAEERLRAFPRVKFDSKEEMAELRKLRKVLPDNIRANRPLCGGSIWYGEKEAWEATKELVNTADKHGQLRGIMDAVRANRIEDDFSSIWSYAYENGRTVATQYPSLSEDGMLCRGHDVSEILVIGLRSLWGTNPAQAYDADDIEKMLRLAYSREDFHKTELSRKILDWYKNFTDEGQYS